MKIPFDPTSKRILSQQQQEMAAVGSDQKLYFSFKGRVFTPSIEENGAAAGDDRIGSADTKLREGVGAPVGVELLPPEAEACAACAVLAAAMAPPIATVYA